MVADKRVCAGEFPFIKPLDLTRLTHYQENSMAETAPTIQLSPHGPAPEYMGIIAIRGGIQVWTQRQTISFFLSGMMKVLDFLSG